METTVVKKDGVGNEVEALFLTLVLAKCGMHEEDMRLLTIYLAGRMRLRPRNR